MHFGPMRGAGRETQLLQPQARRNDVRVFGGDEYEAWLAHPSPDRVKAYRAAGIRCRRSRGTLFVHHMDTDQALAIDQAADGASQIRD